MRLTAYSDYSLRTLAFLAVKGEKKSTLNEIAETYGISKEHLRKIVHNLAKEGYISSSRGRTGGLRINMEPKEINLGQLIRKTEADFTIVECFDPQNMDCILRDYCKLQFILADALKAFFEVLDKYTLEDLIVPRSPLKKVLGLETS